MPLNAAELPLFEALSSPAQTPAAPSLRPTGLWLCIHLPKLALEALDLNPQNTPPCAILDEIKGRPVIHTASSAAESAGITEGMHLSTAHALCPTLQGLPRDPEAETQALRRLAIWAGRFTSAVSLEPPQALLLEIGGSLRLFGSLKTLTQDIGQGLATQGHRFVTAVAPTALASLLLASNGCQTALAREEELRSALGRLPIKALMLDGRQHKRLSKAGIRVLHDLWRLPRDGLARRFGPALLSVLDRALGMQAESRELFQASQHFEAHRELDGEVNNTTVLLEVARDLLARLADDLRRRDAGTTRIRLRLHHARGRSSRLEIGVRQCTRDAAHLFDLLKEHLNRITLSAPVIRIVLVTNHIQPFEASSRSLFADRGSVALLRGEDMEWQRVLEHLQARLGAGALRRLRFVPEHRPERACSHTAVTTQATCSRAPRPLWLLSQPRPLALHRHRPWRRGPLTLLSGPERIESGWWDGQDIRRDYFIAANGDGSRLWVFRDLAGDNAWYLHGYFG